MVLKAKYLFNTGSGSTLVDGSGNGIDASYNGVGDALGWSSDVPKYGGAYSYNFSGAANDSFEVNFANWEGDFTLVLWVKYDGNGGTIALSTGDGGEDSIQIQIVSDNWIIQSKAGGVTKNYIIGAVEQDTWQHLSITHDSSESKLITYLNYNNYTEHTTNDEEFGFSRYKIGKNRNGATLFTGKLDSIWFYNEIISDQDICNIYAYNDPSSYTLSDCISHIVDEETEAFKHTMIHKIASVAKAKAQK